MRQKDKKAKIWCQILLPIYFCGLASSNLNITDIPSLKMRDAIQFENQKNELPFVSLMDQDPPVLELYDQPTGEMKLHDRNREREFSGHGRSTSVPRLPHPAGTRPSSHHIAQSSPRL